MLKSSGFSLWRLWRAWPAWRLGRGLICLIFLALVLAYPAWNAPLEDSEPDWLELKNYLDEIGSGLQMTEQPLSEIESYFINESERLRQEKADLQNEKQQLQQEKNSLDKREQALSEREKDLDKRESLYDGMQTDLEDATTALKRAKILGIIITVAVATAAGYGGYRLGKAIN